MTVDAGEVLRLARLAALTVDDDAVPELAAQLQDILALIGRLPDTPDESGRAFRPGPRQAPLRPDLPEQIPLDGSPATRAPDFADGMFLVPRLESFRDEP